MPTRMTLGLIVLLCLVGSSWSLGQDGAPQDVPPYVPEFTLQCHPTQPVRDDPPDDPSADPFGIGPWYVNDERSIWATSQQLVSDERGNRIMWIKPPGMRLEVTGHRLDGEATPLRVERNEAYLNKGFEPNRLYFETPGCWEITATAGDGELVFVVEVAAPRETPRRR